MPSANQTPIEVRDMGIVHRTLRTTFNESAQLVRAESDPTPERVTFLATHIALTLDLLHVHHHGEDLKLWPVLIERAPAEAEAVREVADQHVGVDSTIQQVRDLLGAWRGAPDAAAREALADSLESLTVVLSAHLDDDDRAFMLAALPPPVQELWKMMGEPGWRQYAAQLQAA